MRIKSNLKRILTTVTLLIISITGARGGIFDIGNIDVEFPAGKYIYLRFKKTH